MAIRNGLVGDLRPGMRVMRFGHFHAVTDVAPDVVWSDPDRFYCTRAITLDNGEVWRAYDFTRVHIAD